MSRRGIFTSALLFCLTWGVLAGLPAGPSTEPRAASLAIRELDLPQAADPFAEETVLANESDFAFALGELLMDTGAVEPGLQEFSYAMESFFFSGFDLEQSPFLQAKLMELFARAELCSPSPEMALAAEEADDEAQTEGSPLDDLAEESPAPVTIDPEIEHLIEQDILNQHYDFPVYVNEEVLSYISYLTTVKRLEVVEAGLQRMQLYRDMFTRVYTEEGLPLDLMYFGLIESNFKINAYSRAKAKGLWQFIESTGRNYGLRIDWWVDERSDPEKATRASCRYLRALYDMFGDWYLVLAAYNSGEGRIQRLLERHPGKDYWALCDAHLLPKETRRYVPAILAAIIVGKNPERFGIRVTPQTPPITIVVDVPSPMDLRVVADTIGESEETLRDLNPSLRRLVTPPDRKTFPIRVPGETSQEILALLYDLPVKERLKWVEHRVQRGHTLYQISRKYGVSLSAIKDANGLRGSRPSLKVGQVLLIPLSDFRKRADRPDRSDEAAERPAPSQARTYKVRPGDTLWSISRRTQVTVPSLIAWNDLHGSAIKAGLVLRLRPRAGEADSPEPAESASATPARPSKAGTGSGTYTVKRGDTLWRISQMHGVTVEALMAANGLRSKSAIKAGQKLAIPGGGTAATSRGEPAPSSRPEGHRTHRVKKGETLFAIAHLYRTDVDSIKRLNGLDGNRIQAGTQLVIPD